MANYPAVPNYPGLSTLYGYSDSPDVREYIGPATAALRQKANATKQRAINEQNVLGTASGGGMQSRLSSIDTSEQASEVDIITNMLAQRAMIDEQNRREEEERTREEKALKDKQSQEKDISTGQMVGEIGGGIVGAVATPFTGGAVNPITGAAMGASLGAGIGGSVEGAKYGASPDLSGIGTVAGYMSDKERQDKEQQYFDSLMKRIELSGQPTADTNLPGDNTGWDMMSWLRPDFQPRKGMAYRPLAVPSGY